MTYKVCFDGNWQGAFDDLDDALDWARKVADTGRLVHVVERRIVRAPKLLRVLPEHRAEEGERMWKSRGHSGWAGGDYGGVPL